MMRIIIILFFGSIHPGFGLVTGNVSGKFDPSDTLMKYSYRINGTVFSESFYTVDGTGCFYKKGDSLYFITAKHVLSGCMMSRKAIWKNGVYPDMLIISGKDVSFFVDIGKIKDTATCLPQLQSPDIISIPVENKFNLEVYSIENFKTDSISNGGQIKIFGFPSDSNIKNGRANYSAPPGELDWDSGSYTAVNHSFINILSSNRQIPPNEKLKGYSGSPVFFKEDGSNEWKISGIFAAIITDTVGRRFVIMPKIDNVLPNKSRSVN